MEDLDKLTHLQQVMDAGRLIHGAMDRVDTTIADRLGINRTDLRCLYHLVDCAQATPSEIAAAVGLTSGSVTAMLDRLESQGLIVRARSCADRRSLAISIPLPERDRIAAVLDEKLSVLRSQFASLDGAELARMAGALGPFAAVVHAVADQLGKSDD